MIVQGQPRRPGNPIGYNPGGGGGGAYTGSIPGGGRGQGTWSQAGQGGVDLNTGQRILPAGGSRYAGMAGGGGPPTPGQGLVGGLPGHMVQEGTGFNPMAHGAVPQGQRPTYQAPPPQGPPPRAAPAVPSHPGFNGVVAPTPGNGQPGFTNEGLGIHSSNQMASPGGWNWSGSGGGGQSYGGNSQQPGGKPAAGAVPSSMAGWGAGVGITPGGGGGAAAGGGGANGNVGSQLQQYMDKANAANEGRYQQLLSMSGQLSDSALQRENIREQNLMGKVSQQAISSGLGNTTVLPNLQRGVVDDSARRQNEVADQGLRTAMGIIERRSDMPPDLGLFGQLASRPGANGASGYGGMVGGVIGGGGHHAQGGSNGWANMLAPSQGGTGSSSSAGSGNFDGGVKGGDYGQAAENLVDNWTRGLSGGGASGGPGVATTPGGVLTGDEIYDNYGQQGDGPGMYADDLIQEYVDPRLMRRGY